MTLESTDQKLAVYLALACGTLGMFTYPLLITYHAQDIWSLLLEVIFGPMYILTQLGFYLLFRRHGHSYFNVLALLFIGIAGFCITLMFNVQKAVFTQIDEYRALTDATQKEMLRWSFSTGNLVQLGMDFCFDIFVSLGTFFFGLAILRQRAIMRWLGYPGILIGLAGLGLNMATFPTPPADVQLPDPGPFFGGFYTLCLLNVYWFIIKARRNGTEWI